MGKRKLRGNAEPIVVEPAKWEPGVDDGVFPRTKKFPVLTTDEMVRAIYNKVIGGGIDNRKSSVSSGGSVWTLEEVDKKPAKKNTSTNSTNKDIKDNKAGVWSLE